LRSAQHCLRELWKCQGCGKRGKPKAGFPPLATSPLEISPQPGEIPTFPQFRLRGRMRKVENEKHVSHFPTAPKPLFHNKNTTRGRGYRFPPEARSARLNHDIYELGNILT
jgi:hypothetical protein